MAPRLDSLDELLQDGHDHEPPDHLRCQHHILQYRLFPPSRSSDSKAAMIASVLPDVSDASFENFNYLLTIAGESGTLAELGSFFRCRTRRALPSGRSSCFGGRIDLAATPSAAASDDLSPSDSVVKRNRRRGKIRRGTATSRFPLLFW